MSATFCAVEALPPLGSWYAPPAPSPVLVEGRRSPPAPRIVMPFSRTVSWPLRGCENSSSLFLNSDFVRQSPECRLLRRPISRRAPMP
jgi:hypothetical protein